MLSTQSVTQGESDGVEHTICHRKGWWWCWAHNLSHKGIVMVLSTQSVIDRDGDDVECTICHTRGKWRCWAHNLSHGGMPRETKQTCFFWQIITCYQTVTFIRLHSVTQDTPWLAAVVRCICTDMLVPDWLILRSLQYGKEVSHQITGFQTGTYPWSQL